MRRGAASPRVERLLVVLASVVLVLALLTGYATRAAFNSNQFANRATAALEDESVRALIAGRITDQVVKQKADLIATRPIISSAAAAVIGSRPFTSTFRKAVRDVHRAVFNHDRDTVTLTLSDVGTVIGAALEKLRPALAKQVESVSHTTLIKANVGSVTGDLARAAKRARVLALILLLITLALIAAALVLSPDRRRTAGRLGIGAASGGAFLLVVYGITRAIAVHHVDGPEAQAAAGAVWDAFLGDLRTAAWILAGSGAVVAGAAASVVRPPGLREPFERAARWLTAEPSRPLVRALRGVGLVGAGLLVILAGDAVLRLALTIVGVFLIYEGATALLRLVYRPPAHGEAEPARASGAARQGLRGVAVGVIAGAFVAAAIGIFLGAGGASTAAPAKGGCNGNAALCDLPLDRVVLPATHNSMSVPLHGWYSAEQDRPIAGQLDDGVRGLLIDAHYADKLPNGRLRTYFGSQAELRRQVKQDGVNPDAVDAAMRLRERLGFKGEGKRGMYLCHTFCELGATPLASVLDDIHDFLVTHPDDVLVIINQDYVTPEDFVAAAGDANLSELAYRGPANDDWLTLRQMIDRNQRVVFLAENHAGAAPWYRPAYKKITEETPYTFPKVAQLVDAPALAKSCEPNRGPAGAPLFLVNHWISTDPLPRPSDATKVNAYGPLLRRARECQKLRKHVPNLLAVNFYLEGDLFKVVDALNAQQVR